MIATDKHTRIAYAIAMAKKHMIDKTTRCGMQKTEEEERERILIKFMTDNNVIRFFILFKFNISFGDL